MKEKSEIGELREIVLALCRIILYTRNQDYPIGYVRFTSDMNRILEFVQNDDIVSTDRRTNDGL